MKTSSTPPLLRLALVLTLAASGTFGSAVAQETTEAAAPLPAFNPDDLPDVVARVNGTEVTRKELIDEARGAFKQLGQMGVRRQLDAQFHREALEQILAAILLSEEAQKVGLAATDEEVATRLASLRSAFENEEKFQAMVAAEGMTLEEFKKDLKRTMSVEKYVARQIATEVTISEEAQRTFYEQNKTRMQRPELVQVRHILVEVKADAGEEERQAAREELAGLAKRLQDGEDFAALAKEHSDDPGSREAGGQLPPIARGQTLPAFEEVAFSLPVGQRKDLVETPLGFHIIEVLNRQEEGIAPFEEVQEQLHQMLKSQAVQVEMKARVEALRLKADVQIFI